MYSLRAPLQKRLHRLGRDGQADGVGSAENGHGNADNLALHIHDWAAGVARVDAAIDLGKGQEASGGSISGSFNSLMDREMSDVGNVK